MAATFLGCLWVCCLLGVQAASSTTAGGEEGTCKAGEVCVQLDHESPARQAAYHWPHPHGRVGKYSLAPAGPFDLTAALRWKWHHPDGKYHDMLMGCAIDDKKNIYVSTDRGIWKLSPDGVALWSWVPRVLPGLAQHPSNMIPNGPALADGAVYIDATDGRFWALDMETGKELWESRPTQAACCDTGSMAAYKGVVIAETDPGEGCGKCGVVRALNASTGDQIWEFRPDVGVWDLMVQFIDDDVIFQDLSGKAYRNSLKDGSLIWKSGGFPNSWTDGTQQLGYNGIVYTTNTRACGGPNCHGDLTAYNVSTGARLWKQDVPRPPNSSPALGKLGKSDRLSVIIPIGQQPNCDPGAGLLWTRFPTLMFNLPRWMQMASFVLMHRLILWLGDWQQGLVMREDLPTDVFAFDAETGAFQWRWEGPVYRRWQCPGDELGFLERSALGIRSASCPTPWSAPRISSDGTIYVGNQNGHFFAIRDHNGNGNIEPATEVHDFDCGAEFTSLGSAHAPGMVVIASGDTVFAFFS